MDTNTQATTRKRTERGRSGAWGSAMAREPRTSRRVRAAPAARDRAGPRSPRPSRAWPLEPARRAPVETSPRAREVPRPRPSASPRSRANRPATARSTRNPSMSRSALPSSLVALRSQPASVGDRSESAWASGSMRAAIEITPLLGGESAPGLSPSSTARSVLSISATEASTTRRVPAAYASAGSPRGGARRRSQRLTSPPGRSSAPRRLRPDLGRVEVVEAPLEHDHVIEIGREPGPYAHEKHVRVLEQRPEERVAPFETRG